jgi:hypothetical protein
MFTPAEFRRRLEAAAPAIPPDLDIKFPEWAPFSAEAVEAVSLSQADKALLLDPGLPRDAAPFLTFGDGLPPMREVQPHLGPEFDGFLCLGSNGCGDTIVVHEADGRVVYHNHDRHMEEVFINSSIFQLAESLCLYQEGRMGDWPFDFLQAVKAVDARAAEEGCMWPAEAPK